LKLVRSVVLSSLLALSPAACGGGGATSEPAAPQPTESSRDPEAPGTPPADAPAPTAAPTTKPPGTQPTNVAPGGVTCLSKHYIGTPAQSASCAWILRLPDGTELPWEDGKTKTFDETLDQPDLQDMFSPPYAVGAIAPVTTLNFDPGRFRPEALFKATFGGSSAGVQTKLVDVPFVGQTLKFHTRAAAALGKVGTKIQALVATTPSLAQYVTGDLGGTFNWRPIANTNRMSAHSYGIAIDIVVSKSNYWEWEKKPDGSFVWVNKIPQSIVDAFESEGFAWGGRWYHYDTMHFEYRPELFDASCK
jgi:D-alanyl-D-alanine carboxypeptidase